MADSTVWDGVVGDKLAQSDEEWAMAYKKWCAETRASQQLWNAVLRRPVKEGTFEFCGRRYG